ncbi:MAG: esterase-like activity of phytase family protein [Cyclobacteriaceae bacterium]|nr:esterase-like activity of phytase family protein [Cyclobacteriaceae bacterium]
MHGNKLLLLFSLLLLPVATCNFTSGRTTISSLKFLGEYEVPYNQNFKGTTVGGLSGIDYDSENQIYYLISDDRSAIHHARFYTAKIFVSRKGVDSVRFVNVQKMLQQNGSTYPNSKQDPKNTPDPESIRYKADSKQLVWTSEGERIISENGSILSDPAITVMDIDGKHSETFPIPANLTMQEIEKGPRRNGVLEALTFTPNYKNMFVCSEVPLHEDGPEADVKDIQALVRIFKFDVATKKNISQYAYKLDPIAYPATPETAFKINGIPDILSLDNNHLLIMERSFSTGRLPCTIKVFLTDLTQADNVASVHSLSDNPPAHLATKKLILNMDDLGIYTDNVEGFTFGPDLPNGHKTLLFVSDNNFLPIEKTQLLLFEVIP